MQWNLRNPPIFHVIISMLNILGSLSMVALLSSAIVSLLCLRLKRDKDSERPVDDLQKRSILMGNGGSANSLSTVCSNLIGDTNPPSTRRHDSYLSSNRTGLVDQMRMGSSSKSCSSATSLETINSRMSSNDKYIHSNQARIPWTNNRNNNSIFRHLSRLKYSSFILEKHWNSNVCHPSIFINKKHHTYTW